MAKKPRPDDNPESRNPTGNQRRASAGQRRKVDRRTYGGTPWQKPEDKKGK